MSAIRKIQRGALVLGALLGLVIAAEQPAEACFMVAPQPVQVTLDRIEVHITDGVAVKNYYCVFKNPNGGAIVGGQCYMEIEPGAQIDKMSMIVNGKEVEAEMLDRPKADKVFQQLVKDGASPALLEYYGNALVTTKVPKVPAGGEVVVKLQYTQVLKPKGGVYRMRMLNTNPKMNMQQLEQAQVDIYIDSQQPVINVYSPTHDISVSETKTDVVHVSWSEKDYLPKNPFVFYYATTPNPVGATMLTYQDPYADGHFMLMLSPPMGRAKVDVADKDIVFVTDTSGSMLKDGKMKQAQAALRYCLENLRPGDRFNIVDFSTEARLFQEQLQQATPENIAKALHYVDEMRARGGTAIAEALEMSLDQLAEGDRLKMVLFTTDGLPTIGERDSQKILEQVREGNTNGVRIFSFGEGLKVNSRLLDTLAFEHRGDSDYVLPSENIGDKIGRYFDKVGSPLLTDLKVEIDGVKTSDVYPRVVPDLFKGDQVVVFGRYQDIGQATVRLSGQLNGETRHFEIPVEFTKEPTHHEFVPRLWAGQKVDFLLGEIRQGGEDEELIDEIVKLAKLHGIVTPYTAFIASPDVMTTATPDALTRRLRMGAVEELKRDKSAFDGESAPSGEALERENQKAYRWAQGRKKIKGGDFYDRAQAEWSENAGGGGGSVMQVMRYNKNRTFYNSQGTWTDSRYEGKKETEVLELKANSDEFFDFLSNNPEAAQYLAMGKVLFEFEGRFVKVE